MEGNTLILLVLGLALGMAMVMGIVIGSIPLAALVYVWKNLYPLVKRIAKWSAQLENLLSLAIIDGVLFFIIIATFALGLPLLIVMFVFLLIPFAFVLLVPIYLGVLVWIIRFTRRFYARWRIWLIVGYMRFRAGRGGGRRSRISRRRRT